MRRVRALASVLVTTVSLLGATSCQDNNTTTSSSSTTTLDPGSAVPSDASSDTSSAVESLTVKVLDRRPHDTAAFTEGLTFGADGTLYESLGLDGQSSIRQVDPATGKVVRESELAPDQFGEGIAIGLFGLVQLTWKNGVANLWAPDTLESKGTVSFEGEGWGLTFDGKEFVQSDGSSRLTRRDADTFAPVGTVDVTRAGRPVDQLNELEWVDGVIYANVWHSDEILRIDPASGRVTGVIDASKLWQGPERGTEMTLNGIAHRSGDPADRLWLTGKNWPELFEVDVVPA